MEFTGERMVPERADPATFWHHVYRYKFAIPFCRDRRVLDVACGEGYGCASIIKGGASHVIGVDISEEACRHARARYGVEAITGSAEEIPVPDQSVDVVTTFETIEHLPHPERFIKECARVLPPGGRLILSSPNRDLYRKRNGLNPFHCSEMSEQEILALLDQDFLVDGVYGQYPELQPAGLIHPPLWPYAMWLQMKGWNRIRKMVRRLTGAYFFAVPAEFYDDPAEAVINEPPTSGRASNPNMVRFRPVSPHLDFVFFVITAVRKN